MKKVQIPTCMSPFIVDVNGKRYIYPAGTEQEVPDEVAIIIEKHNKSHEAKHAPTVPPFESGLAIQSATVGQTIVVEEVDEEGKVTKCKGADYQPRTHWSEEGQEDIVPEIAFTPVSYESFGAYMHPLPSFELEEGKTYTVIFDGVSYTCTAFSGALSDTQSIVGIGNSALAGGANTGEPFGVTVVSNHTAGTVLQKLYFVICFDNNEHTVRVIEDKIVPHKIPEEYVTPSVFYVFAAIKDHSTATIALLTPWDDIIEAVYSGKIIYLRYEEYDFNFDQYGNPNTFFTVENYICSDAKVGINSLECSIKFIIPGNSDGTVNYCTIARDKDGVTTIT